MECPACGGRGCSACRAGEIEITRCPLEIITADVWQVIQYAEFFEKGLPPVAGGVTDQAAVFLEAAQFVFGEQQYWKNKLGIIG